MASAETAQLLLIVSDGRGLFLEGKDRVLAAVQAAQNANIFVIFVVLDNPNSRVSERVPKAAILQNLFPSVAAILSRVAPHNPAR